jgi:hypothetical protein
MEKRGRHYILSVPSYPSQFLHVHDDCGIIASSSFYVELACCYLWSSAASVPTEEAQGCACLVWWAGAPPRAEEEERVRKDIRRANSRPLAEHAGPSPLPLITDGSYSVVVVGGIAAGYIVEAAQETRGAARVYRGIKHH